VGRERVECDGELLRTGRALAAGDTGDVTGARSVAGGDAGAESVCRADGAGLGSGDRVAVAGRGRNEAATAQTWFADQLTHESVLYNVAAAVRLTGPLDVSALARTLREIIARHEVLRTSFPAIEGRPIQVIAPASDFIFDITDLTHLEFTERETEAYRLALEEAQKPFDLSSGPLLRALLLRLSEAEHVALFTMHHIVSDGWSRGVLIKEVSQLYEAYSRGEESPLTELPIQYADYAVWQREWLTGEVLDKQLQYWREQLAGAPETLALPTDKPRPS